MHIYRSCCEELIRDRILPPWATIIELRSNIDTSPTSPPFVTWGRSDMLKFGLTFDCEGLQFKKATHLKCETWPGSDYDTPNSIPYLVYMLVGAQPHDFVNNTWSFSSPAAKACKKRHLASHSDSEHHSDLPPVWGDALAFDALDFAQSNTISTQLSNIHWKQLQAVCKSVHATLAVLRIEPIAIDPSQMSRVTDSDRLLVSGQTPSPRQVPPTDASTSPPSPYRQWTGREDTCPPRPMNAKPWA